MRLALLALAAALAYRLLRRREHEHRWYVTGHDFSLRCSGCGLWEEQVQPPDDYLLALWERSQ